MTRWLVFGWLGLGSACFVDEAPAADEDDTNGAPSTAGEAESTDPTQPTPSSTTGVVTSRDTTGGGSSPGSGVTTREPDPTGTRGETGTTDAPDESSSSGGFFCEPLMFDDRDYLLCTLDVSWGEARDACDDMGMKLVTVEDAAEHAWLATQTDDPLGTWIGARDLAIEGDWVWVGESEPFFGPGAPGGAFTAWGTFEPNNLATEDCAAILVESEVDVWFDFSCEDENPFVCEALG